MRGASGSGTAAFRYALTDVGRDRARQYLDVNQYVGAAPVPLAAYVAYMSGLREARGYIDRERLRRGFSHLVISDDVLEQLGPAVNAGKAVFLYGPPGNGKTVIAEGMGGALGGDMYIPHAIDVDGQIITMFDPINHESLEPENETVEHHRHGAARSPLGAHQAAGGHGRRRADARHARPARSTRSRSSTRRRFS